MFKCILPCLFKNNAEKKNLYSRMVDYVHEHCVFFDFNSKNGHDILWFPLQVPLNVSMYDFLEDIFKKYCALLCQQKFKDEILPETIDTVKKVSIGILKVLKTHMTGDIIDAYNEFETLMESYYENVFPIKPLEKGKTFYRMRADKHNLKDKNEFYPLPLKLRHLCPSCRFSIAGYPCLYLGYSKSVCFEEISHNGTMCGVELPKEEISDLMIYDLTFPEESNGNIDPDIDMKFIKAWPLIASCYIIMGNEQINKDGKFREEYIIPQMLTTYLRHKTSYYGICYYSTRNEKLDPFGKGEDDFRNVVLFPKKHDKEGNDMNLINMFHWYEPFNVGTIKQDNK